jgi:TetR/AcrR family transcriptional regulator
LEQAESRRVKKRAKRKVIREKVSRNPEQTQQRILAAALKEFAQHGFAGARVDVIARSARINKRMLYHYFGNKEELFRAVLRRKISERKAWFADAPQNVLESLPWWVELMASDPDWIRLLQFEALNWGEGKAVIDEARRRRDVTQAIEKLKQQQAAGLAPAELDTGHLLLALLALSAYPFAFPQFARFATGLRVSSPEFQKQHAEFLRRLAMRLKGR